MARQRRRRLRCLVALLAVLSVPTLPVATAGAGSNDPAEERTPNFETFGTKPPRLDAADIARAAAAFGIEGEPERMLVPPGWEVEDDVRALYLTRAPSAWYAHFTDSSALLGPVGDRAAICARPDAPFGCTEPDVEFLADVGADPPDATTATATAEEILERAGFLSGSWDVVVMEASHDPVPCPDESVSQVACTRQVVPSRTVMLTREFGPGTVAARWGVIVGPSGLISAVGRIAVPR